MSKPEIYDIGTKIRYEPSFDHNSKQKASFSIKQHTDLFSSTRSIFLRYQNVIESIFFFVFRRFACDLGFAAYDIFCPKAPCGTTFGLKNNLICPNGPCGPLFWLKIQFCPPKSLLWDELAAQNNKLSAQKAPAG